MVARMRHLPSICVLRSLQRRRRRGADGCMHEAPAIYLCATFPEKEAEARCGWLHACSQGACPSLCLPPAPAPAGVLVRHLVLGSMLTRSLGGGVLWAPKVPSDSGAGNTRAPCRASSPHPRPSIAAAVSLCNPWNLTLGDYNWRRPDAGFRRAYDAYLACGLELGCCIGTRWRSSTSEQQRRNLGDLWHHLCMPFTPFEAAPGLPLHCPSTTARSSARTPPPSSCSTHVRGVQAEQGHPQPPGAAKQQQ